MIKTTKIKIKGKNYTMKASSFRAMFLFEDITGKQVSEMKELRDIVTYLYCILKSSNKDFGYELEEFYDILDDNPDIVQKFTDLALKKK